MAGIKGHASKVGGYGGKYDYANPTDPIQHDPAAIGAMAKRGTGRKYGRVLSAAKGAGIAAIKGRKAGGIKLKGGTF
jgi:hypothetical protein